MLRARENQADDSPTSRQQQQQQNQQHSQQQQQQQPLQDAGISKSTSIYKKYIPEKVGDLEARGRKVEELYGVATVPRLSKGVSPAGLGQLVESQKQISRLHFRVRHAYRLVVGVQLEGVRCNDAVQARSAMYDVTVNATVGGVELSSHHHIKRGERRLAPTLGGRCL